MLNVLSHIRLRNTLLLLRIPFSALLAPVYFLALSQVPVVQPLTAWSTFLILHLLVYPASNGYNSYADRDTGSIGGIEHPPLPTRHLFYTALALDLSAIVLSLLFVNAAFTFMVAMYITASRLYSAPQTRLKRFPFISFVVVTFFQGGFACYMAMTGISGALPYDGNRTLWLLSAASLQIAGVYPLTQVYQHEQDRQSGVTTISMLLGIKGTFIFSGSALLLADLSFLQYFLLSGKIFHFYILQLFLFPALIYFIRWGRQVFKDEAAASYSRTMNMSWLSALCMNACFLLLFFIGG